MLLTGFGYIEIDEIEPRSYREIVAAWCAQRGDRPFPLKEQIDPFVVPILAANIILYEVAGEDLIIRLLGEKVVTNLGTGLKGRTLRQVLGDTDYTRTVERQLHDCAANGLPLYSRHDFQLPGEFVNPVTRKAWRIALPYGDEARVTRLLCYQLFSQDIETHAQKKIDFEGLLPKTVFRIRV